MIHAKPDFLQSDSDPTINRLIGLHIHLSGESLEQFTTLLSRALNTADPHDPTWKGWVELQDRIKYGMPLPKLRD